MNLRKSKSGLLAVILTIIASVVIAACGGSSTNTNTKTGGGSTGTSSTPATANITAHSFDVNFSAMSQLKSLAAAGKGKVAAILPDTTSSTRYVEFDEPYLKKAAALAGLPASDMIVQNAQGSDTTFLTDAQADITNGATVLLIDPEDSGTGLRVEQLAAQKGVAVINYDRLTLGGPADAYVSFNNVRVGRDIGTGFVKCVQAWHVTHPKVIMMHGSPTDNNATLFSEGYQAVLNPLFKSGRYTLAANTAGTWTPTVAQTEFEQALTAHSSANSAVIPNDENGAPIITYLKSKGVKPYTFPTTGQDATLTGLQNILSGYQCGTVYKPIYQEAQAAVALAIYKRAQKTPPASLLNGTVVDPTNHKTVPSVLLTPEWVTQKNMNSTVIADKFVPASQLCKGNYAADCKKFGIS